MAVPLTSPMVYKGRYIALAAGVLALAGGAMVSNSVSAGGEDREWWEKSHCAGLDGVSWIECQKAISRKKRNRKQGISGANRPKWWEKSRCLGLEGLSWIE